MLRWVSLCLPHTRSRDAMRIARALVCMLTGSINFGGCTPINVPALLGRPLEVSLTKESGLAGLIFLIRQHLGIDLPKDHPSITADYEWVTA